MWYVGRFPNICAFLPVPRCWVRRRRANWLSMHDLSWIPLPQERSSSSSSSSAMSKPHSWWSGKWTRTRSSMYFCGSREAKITLRLKNNLPNMVGIGSKIYIVRAPIFSKKPLFAWWDSWAYTCEASTTSSRPAFDQISLWRRVSVSRTPALRDVVN